jgi:hypothetical protein
MVEIYSLWLKKRRLCGLLRRFLDIYRRSNKLSKTYTLEDMVEARKIVNEEYKREENERKKMEEEELCV